MSHRYLPKPHRFVVSGRVRLLALTIAALALPAPAAQAATIDLGSGYDPSVAVDSTGTAYIAYSGVDATPDSSPPVYAPLHVCVLPRGATACSSSERLTPPGDTVRRPYAFVDAAGTVRVLAYRYGLSDPAGFAQDFLYTSTDGARSFAPPVSVGVVDPQGGAVAGPGASLSVLNDANASHGYQDLPIDGSSARGQHAALSNDYPYDSSIGLFKDSTPVAVFDDGHASPGPTAAFSMYTGSGSLNDTAAWSAPSVIGPAALLKLAGGPSGLFLMSETTSGAQHLELRTFTGSAFGAPVPVPGGTGSLVDSFISEDPAGGLHILWNAGEQQLKYLSSVNPNPTVVATGDPDFGGVRTGLAGDHRGFAVWQTGGGAGRHIHVVPLAPPSPALARLKLPAVEHGTKVSGAVIGVPAGSTVRIDLTSGSVRGIIIVGGRILKPNVQGGSTRFAAKLNSRARRVLARRGQLRLTVRVKTTIAGQTAVQTKTITLERR